jgi:hypothetical protein
MQFTTSSFVALASAIATLSTSVAAKFEYGTASSTYFGVVARNANGPTNPSAPSLGTTINQTSVSRLVSINSIDDWCTFSSPDGEIIADVEAITVAYCTKARNDARVIPDGTLTAVHFVQTPLYLQVMALGDFTKIGMQAGDEGGELDPHGATNLGNPVGGNVTSNVTGTDVFYEEWMNFISYNQVCFRVCIAGSEEAPTPLECLHTLDEMGCNFVMPGNYDDDSFDTCDGDSAYPPGNYPLSGGGTSTFQQYYSSVYTAADGVKYTFVNGSPDETTPTAAYSTPSTSNCVTQSTISNGFTEILVSTTASGSSTSATSTGSSSSSTSKSSKSSTSTSGSAASTISSSSSSTTTTSGAGSLSTMPVLAIVGVVSVAMAAMLL